MLDGLEHLFYAVTRLPEYSPQQLLIPTEPNAVKFISDSMLNANGLTIYNAPYQANPGYVPTFSFGGATPSVRAADADSPHSYRILLLVFRYIFTDGPMEQDMLYSLPSVKYELNEYHRVSCNLNITNTVYSIIDKYGF